MKTVVVLLIAILLTGCSASAPKAVAFQDTKAEGSSAAFLTDVKSWVMASSTSKRTYQISVALSDGYSNERSPYPVLYAVDANTEFGTVVETARLLAFLREVPDLVVVGIGYPNPGVGFTHPWHRAPWI